MTDRVVNGGRGNDCPVNFLSRWAFAQKWVALCDAAWFVTLAGNIKGLPPINCKEAKICGLAVGVFTPPIVSGRGHGSEQQNRYDKVTNSH